MQRDNADMTGGASAVGKARGLGMFPAPERVLIKAVNWLGDLVMSQPAMRAVRRALPGARLSILVRSELAGFFSGAGWVDEVIPYSLARGLGGVADRLRIVMQMRKRRFGLAVLMPNSFDSALWAAGAGIPMRAGFATDARGAMLTHKARAPRDALDGHQVHYWLAMVRKTLGIEGDPNDFAITADPAAVSRMRQWLASNQHMPDAPMIAIAPATAYGPAKQWPPEKFAALADALWERMDAESVLVGAPSERAQCERVAATAHSRPVIAAGHTGVAELIAMLSLAQAFVGNDSGCMHVAAALGIPTVGIFGSTDPRRTGPLGRRARAIWHHLECSPCFDRTCRFGHYNCLRRVEVEEVLDALAELEATGTNAEDRGNVR